jgi:hypothetical protein
MILRNYKTTITEKRSHTAVHGVAKNYINLTQAPHPELKIK